MSSVPEYPRAALHRIADAIGPQQPGENGQQDDVGTAVRYQGEGQFVHGGYGTLSR